MVRNPWIFVFLFLALNAFAQSPSPLSIERPPAVDGVLDEPGWGQAPVIDDFLQRFPREGAKPGERTEVRILYTKDALYIGVQAYDSHPEAIQATAMRRDDETVVNNDQFAMAIDSHNDGRSGFWFSTNPLGVRVDAQFFDEGDIWEGNWNGIWECRTSVGPEGWTAEIEIPFSTLRFADSEETIMGINFFRRIIRTNEALFSPLVPLSYSNGTPNVSIARKYRFRGIRSGRRIVLKPYVLSGVQQETEADSDLQGKAGLDMRYPITGGFTSYFSLNTDFAEAEADELQVNLTRFPLFFPEKRDFFLENAGDFSFGVPQDTELFFSRRIGLSAEDEPVPVLFGARAAGKLRSLDLGLMNVQARNDGSAAAENFSAARLRMAVAPRSYVGGIFTGRAADGHIRSSYGADALLYFGHNISFTAFGSGVSGTGATSERAAWYAALGRSGEATSFLLSYLDVGNQFDPAVGFVRRTDVRTWTGRLAIPRYWNAHGIRNVTPAIQGVWTNDHRGTLLDATQKASFDLVFQSEDRLSLFAEHFDELVPEPFPVFRDIHVPAGRYNQHRAGVTASTKEGRPLSTSLTFSDGGFYDGNRKELLTSVLYRANRNFQFTFAAPVSFARLNGESFHVFLSRLRVDWALNTRISASALLQYDNELRQTAMNLRFRYLFHEGTELFVVYDLGSTDEAPAGNSHRLLIKFTYQFS